MATADTKPVFPSNLHWGGPAHRQKMPFDIPDVPRAGEMANVLAFRRRSGATEVTVTWRVEGQVNLSCRQFDYDSPREALDAGWELGERYEQNAAFMERMTLIYG